MLVPQLIHILEMLKGGEFILIPAKNLKKLILVLKKFPCLINIQEVLKRFQLFFKEPLI